MIVQDILFLFGRHKNLATYVGLHPFDRKVSELARDTPGMADTALVQTNLLHSPLCRKLVLGK